MADKKVQLSVDQKTSNAIRCVNWMQQQFNHNATIRDVYLAAASSYKLAPTNFVLVHSRCGVQNDNNVPLSYFWEEIIKLQVKLVCDSCRYSAEDPDLKVLEKQAGRMEVICGLCHESGQLWEEVQVAEIHDNDHRALVKQAIRVARNALRSVQNKSSVEN